MTRFNVVSVNNKKQYTVVDTISVGMLAEGSKPPGTVSWYLVKEDGKAIPVTKEDGAFVDAEGLQYRVTA